MARHQAANARIVPIMLRHCDFSGSLFSKIQGLPTDMKPVTSWLDQDEAWTDVVRGLKTAFEKFLASSNGTRSPETRLLFHSEPLAETRRAMRGCPRDGLSVAQEENRALAATATEGIEGLSEWEGGSED